MQGTPDSRSGLTLLSFDYGRRRIGVAVGQQVTRSASPVGTAANGDRGPDWQKIGRWITEWQPDRLIVGMPYLADGSPSPLAAHVETFVSELGRFQLPVKLVDERYTSREAEERLLEARAAGARGRIRKETVDAAAAVLIAERWMHDAGAPPPSDK